MVDIGRRGGLVGHESGNGGFPRAFHLQDSPQGLFFGNAYRAETRAEFQEETVEPFVIERPVYLGENDIGGVCPQGDGGNPFPVAEMSQQNNDGAVLGKNPIDDFYLFEYHAAAHLFVGNVHEFDCFDDVVAEVMVKFFFELFQLFFILVGEGVAQIFLYQFPAVMYNVVEREKQYVG